jgi:hypothetical protein
MIVVRWRERATDAAATLEPLSPAASRAVFFSLRSSKFVVLPREMQRFETSTPQAVGFQRSAISQNSRGWLKADR